MTWEFLSVIGTIAFAISGAIIAMEEEYDLLGVYTLGIVTAFGGGAMRNVLIGAPISALWSQGTYFIIALLSITVVFLFPANSLKHWDRWGNFTDAVGLVAFAIQGALFAIQLNQPLSAVIAAAVLTGCGGGIVRDILAGRKPLVFHKEIYVVWAVLTGFILNFDMIHDTWEMYALFIGITSLRVLSYTYNWELPSKKLPQSNEKTA